MSLSHGWGSSGRETWSRDQPDHTDAFHHLLRGKLRHQVNRKFERFTLYIEVTVGRNEGGKGNSG